MVEEKIVSRRRAQVYLDASLWKETRLLGVLLKTSASRIVEDGLRKQIRRINKQLDRKGVPK